MRISRDLGERIGPFLGREATRHQGGRSMHKAYHPPFHPTSSTMI